MNRLKVRLFGSVVTEIDLNPTKEYTAGRGSNCEIVLQPEKGISRQHFKVQMQNGFWKVEILSKFGDLFSNGEKIQTLELKAGTVFQVPPYEFEFSDPTQSNMPEATSDRSASSDGSDTEERTMIGQRIEVPYLRTVDEFGEDKQLMRLAGNGWIAGREANCDIVIDDVRVSRRQFELIQSSDGYYVRDLGSVNGTLVNGNPIASNESVKLKSGDHISVLDNNFYFEMRDPDFQNQVKLAAPIAHAAPLQTVGPQVFAVAPQTMPNYYSPPPQQDGSGYEAPAFANFATDGDQKTKFIRMALAVVILVAGAYYYLFEMDQHQKNSQQNIAMDPFSKLPMEKQNLVRHSYQMSKNLYMKGSYQLAYQELSKLHEIINEYKDSREIEQYCQQAIVMQKEIENEERKTREAEERKQKIVAVVEVCKTQLGPQVEAIKIEECLQPALELDPENELISALRGEAQRIVDERQMKATERQAYLAQVKKRQNLFEKAADMEKQGSPLAAIKAYEKFKTLSLPDPYRLKQAADRKIASIQQDIGKQVADLTAKSKQYEADQNLKEAILSLKIANRIDPKNQRIRSDIARLMSDLTKKMKNLYQESVLEEGLGKMDDAKDKWSKIRTQSLPEEEYYQKSQMKMRNHGLIK